MTTTERNVGTEVEGADRLPIDDFRESVPVSIYGRRQRDGSDAGVDNTGNEKSQGHCCRFVALLLLFSIVVKRFGYCVLELSRCSLNI